MNPYLPNEIIIMRLQYVDCVTLSACINAKVFSQELIGRKKLCYNDNKFCVEGTAHFLGNMHEPCINALRIKYSRCDYIDPLTLRNLFNKTYDDIALRRPSNRLDILLGEKYSEKIPQLFAKGIGDRILAYFVMSALRYERKYELSVLLRNANNMIIATYWAEYRVYKKVFTHQYCKKSLDQLPNCRFVVFFLQN